MTDTVNRNVDKLDEFSFDDNYININNENKQQINENLDFNDEDLDFDDSSLEQSEIDDNSITDGSTLEESSENNQDNSNENLDDQSQMHSDLDFEDFNDNELASEFNNTFDDGEVDNQNDLDTTDELSEDTHNEDNSTEIQEDMTKETEDITSETFDETNEDIETEDSYDNTQDELEPEVNTENKNTKEKDNKKIPFIRKEENKTLYIITDKDNTNLINYYRGYGLNVSNIFTNLDDARNATVMSIEKIRLVIIETGTGKFTSIAARKDLLDIAGLANDDINISIFYTDNIVKKEIEYDASVDISKVKWYKYRSTADVLANMLQYSKKYKENYILDAMAQKTKDKDENILAFKGGTDKYKSSDLGSPLLSLKDIILHHENEDESEEIEAYNVVY